MAESNFNPFAVSPAGAAGIAQFMPGTAAAYGLDDPFDAEAAIDAQAHLMSDLLEQFGDVSLALAAYNAGPGAVEPCMCVPRLPRDPGLRRADPRADGAAPARRSSPAARRRWRCGWSSDGRRGRSRTLRAMPPLTISGIDELQELIGKPVGP